MENRWIDHEVYDAMIHMLILMFVELEYNFLRNKIKLLFFLIIS